MQMHMLRFKAIGARELVSWCQYADIALEGLKLRVMGLIDPDFDQVLHSDHISRIECFT